MDSDTFAAYQQDSFDFAEDWHTQPPGRDLHDVVRRFFRPGPTADIGCGAGRDTAWLVDKGFSTIGLDPSPNLLAEARRRHPGIEFRLGGLPELDGVANRAFRNVLCETVIMHLPASQVTAAVHRLADIVLPTGVLYLSWRTTTGGDRRDEHGRLYSAFDADVVRAALAGADPLLDEQKTSASSNKTIHRIVARV